MCFSPMLDMFNCVVVQLQMRYTFTLLHQVRLYATHTLCSRQTLTSCCNSWSDREKKNTIQQKQLFRRHTGNISSVYVLQITGIRLYYFFPSRCFFFLVFFDRLQPDALEIFVTTSVLILCASTQWMDDLIAVFCHGSEGLVTPGGIDHTLHSVGRADLLFKKQNKYRQIV